jgi:hypothetical protein
MLNNLSITPGRRSDKRRLNSIFYSFYFCFGDAGRTRGLSGRGRVKCFAGQN